MVEHGSTDVGMQSFYQDIELNTQEGTDGLLEVFDETGRRGLINTSNAVPPL